MADELEGLYQFLFLVPGIAGGEEKIFEILKDKKVMSISRLREIGSDNLWGMGLEKEEAEILWKASSVYNDELYLLIAENSHLLAQEVTEQRIALKSYGINTIEELKKASNLEDLLENLGLEAEDLEKTVAPLETAQVHNPPAATTYQPAPHIYSPPPLPAPTNPYPAFTSQESLKYPEPPMGMEYGEPPPLHGTYHMAPSPPSPPTPPPPPSAFPHGPIPAPPISLPHTHSPQTDPDRDRDRDRELDASHFFNFAWVDPNAYNQENTNYWQTFQNAGETRFHSMDRQTDHQKLMQIIASTHNVQWFILTNGNEVEEFLNFTQSAPNVRQVAMFCSERRRDAEKDTLIECYPKIKHVVASAKTILEIIKSIPQLQ